MGFSRKDDENSARLLSTMALADSCILKTIITKDVIVCGDAKVLKRHIEKLGKNEGNGKERAIISADGATSKLLDVGLIPDIIVSDLDGCVEDILEANRKGAVVVVHAHGDNIHLVREHVPALTNVVGTTQSKPFDTVYNFGGFTDGDRCAYMATAFGANNILLLGFDFDDASVSYMKRKKLRWASYLLSILSEVVDVQWMEVC